VLCRSVLHDSDLEMRGWWGEGLAAFEVDQVQGRMRVCASSHIKRGDFVIRRLRVGNSRGQARALSLASPPRPSCFPSPKPAHVRPKIGGRRPDAGRTSLPAPRARLRRRRRRGRKGEHAEEEACASISTRRWPVFER